MKARGVSVWVAVVGLILVIPHLSQPIAQDGSTLTPNAKRDLVDAMESDKKRVSGFFTISDSWTRTIDGFNIEVQFMLRFKM